MKERLTNKCYYSNKPLKEVYKMMASMVKKVRDGRLGKGEGMFRKHIDNPFE
jgi:hypothetical protein